MKSLKVLIVVLTIAVVALAGSTIYLEVRGPSSSYVDGYNFAVAFTRGDRSPGCTSLVSTPAVHALCGHFRTLAGCHPVTRRDYGVKDVKLL
ncbi:MAG: hypothetical protein WA860_12460 [Acidimicrobiales bacterium]